jgi:STE24 endopeptidase
MRQSLRLLAPWVFVVLSLPLAQLQAQTSDTGSVSAAQAADSQPGHAQSALTQPTITHYTLPPDRYKKAHDLGRIHFRFNIISFIYGLVVLWLILRLKLAPKYREWVEKISSRRFVQALVYAPLFLATVALLGLPADVYQEWVERVYGLSVQSWSSWAWDWTKGQLISYVVGIVLIWLLYVVIRRSARRWWFYFWLVSLPIGLFIVFVTPLVIDPLFHKFEPLQQKDPALTANLEQMVQRAGQNIPPERMFWMGAGEKTTGLNAYVTGFGASKRIVVWDTTIAKMSSPQIVFVAGHEMGHYVLQHLPKGLGFAAVLLFVLFYLGYRIVGWVLQRWGAQWRIRGLEDWASLPVLLLLLSIFSFIANPLGSAISRYLEHQADQYGLEVTHGLTPNSQQVAAQAFQILGDVDLSDPEPNPVGVFLFYSHPTIPDRILFCLAYDPWAQGRQGEFVK